MQTSRERVDKYIRSIPEIAKETQKLSFGCEIRRFNNTPKEIYVGERSGYGMIFRVTGETYRDKEWKIIGHPLQLHHYLKVLAKHFQDCIQFQFDWESNTTEFQWEDENEVIHGLVFPLTPPSEWPDEVYDKLAEILNV